MKKKIFSSLLLAAIGFAVTSSVVSCKDYDDDINDLQSQINKLATQDALTNMQSTLNSAITASESKITSLLADYAKKSELAEVKKLAEDAQKLAESAGSAAATAQQAANTAAGAAEAANILAGKAKDASQLAQETADKAKEAAGAADTKAQQGIDDAKKAMEKAVEAFNKANAEAGAKELAQQVKDLADQLKKSTEDMVTKAALADEISKATQAFTPIASDASLALTKAQEADKKADEALQKAKDALAAAGSGSAGGVSKDEVAKMIEEAAASMAGAAGAAELAQQAAADALKKAQDAFDKADAAEKAAGKVAGDLQTLTDNAFTKAEAEALAKIVSGLSEALAKAATKEELQNISGEAAVVGNSVNELFQAVTNVELYTTIYGSYEDNANVYDGSAAWRNAAINFIKAEEIDGVFPKNALKASATDTLGNQYTFKKGDIKTFTDSVIVRVSPSNADLAKAQAIKLINSKGADLDEFVEVVKVEQYDKLLTRGANASGLWKVTFGLKDTYTPENAEKFLTSVQFKEGKEDPRNILFAVGVQNTKENRIVCSSYDVTVRASDATHATEDFLVKGLDGEWKSVSEIHNRYEHCEQAKDKSETKISTEDVPEYEWDWSLNKDDKVLVPAGVVITEGKEANVKDRDPKTDNRQDKDFLAVSVDEKIEICIDGIADANGNVVPQNIIKGFIVRLDEYFALESNNTELAGWKYYEYENLNILQDGNMGYVTVKDLKDVTPEGDIIGFRVFAVNLDGTIVNPDGRAFYVKVMPSVNNKDVALDIIATKAGDAKLVSEKPNYALSKDDALLAGTYKMEIKSEDKAYPKDEPTAYKVNFLNKDGKKVVKTLTVGATLEITEADLKNIEQIQFETSNIEKFYDGATYDQQIKVYDEDNVLIQIINCKMTKVMPTTVKALQFRPKQEVDPSQALPKIISKDGTNAFISFMIPNTNKWTTPWDFALSDESYVIGSEDADNGWKDLNNIFYDLNKDENYKFVFKASQTTDKKNQDLEPITFGNISGKDGYSLAVQTEYIDGKTWHNVELSAIYPGVSTYIDKDNNEQFGKDYAVPSSIEYKVMYACWHHAASYAWGVDKNKKSLQPKLQWEAVPSPSQKAEAGSVLIKSTYNASLFEGTIEDMLKDKFLKVNTKEGKEPTLTYGTQVNPYFEPTINASTGAITFSQKNIQSDANPTADHIESLTINFLDAYGHEVAVVLPVQILKAKASAAKGI